ncbi:MAG: hypothetical protein HY909_03435 [Deltaproteobacteria bacterium]|nr:hypothetical protein [Deltaproteobacteria bacterium]
MEIPDHITLKFAPGARIELYGGVTLVLRGSLDAGPFQLFGSQEGREVRDPLPNRPPKDGRVILASRRIPVVYPEWFGATSSQASGATRRFDAEEGFQAAIDAAVVLRGALPPLPIMVTGEYKLAGALYVDKVPRQGPALSPELEREHLSPGNPLLLRGAHGIGSSGEAHGRLFFTRAGAPPTSQPLPPALNILTGRGFDVQHIALLVDAPRGGPAREVFAAAVAIEPPAQTAGGPGRSVTGRFTHCTFNGGRVATVAILGEPSDPDQPPPQPASRYIFDHCAFILGGLNAVGEGRVLTPRGLYVRGPSSLFVDVGSSIFAATDPAGDFRSFVHAEGGAVLLNGCDLHAASPVAYRPRADRESGGEDVVLGANGGATAEDHALLEAFGTTAWSERRSPEPAALTMLGCESQSAALLLRAAVPTEGTRHLRRLQRNAVLVGTRHSDVNLGDSPVGTEAGPSVRWGGLAPVDGNLVLVGCRFSSWVQLSPSASARCVADIGSSFREGHVLRRASALGSALTLAPPFFRLGGVGVDAEIPALPLLRRPR